MRWIHRDPRRRVSTVRSLRSLTSREPLRAAPPGLTRRQVVCREGPPPHGRRRLVPGHLDRGAAVDDDPVAERRALLDDGARADDAAPPEPAEVADDRARLDERAGAEVAAVDHAARPDDDVVLEDELVVREEV